LSSGRDPTSSSSSITDEPINIIKAAAAHPIYINESCVVSFAHGRLGVITFAVTLFPSNMRVENLGHGHS
jgi:hypothetical protein